MSNVVLRDRPAPSNIKVTREDWLDAARAMLITKGVEHVKVLSLADRLGVSRSSFYWYFRDRADLLATLIALWQSCNTREVVEQAERPSTDIVDGVLHVFECWIEGARFDPRLDFAVREWSRRDPALRALVISEDACRVNAIAGLFSRHGFASGDAFIRARILYFTQIGYYTLELNETEEHRLLHTTEWVRAFTGLDPDPGRIVAYQARVRQAGATA